MYSIPLQVEPLIQLEDQSMVLVVWLGPAFPQGVDHHPALVLDRVHSQMSLDLPVAVVLLAEDWWVLVDDCSQMFVLDQDIGCNSGNLALKFIKKDHLLIYITIDTTNFTRLIQLILNTQITDKKLLIIQDRAQRLFENQWHWNVKLDVKFKDQKKQHCLIIFYLLSTCG